ncbi:hypothetical protein BC936DRAFT_147266 [Jimgerdemannia flammicorona]|uniref:Fatty acid hydroxylase domain-containing protein n=1 Tax=Jimgerdemannia flammicorona TaxID=994334 RepID=A0A433DL32_9FUNG|nr:hypothetical protein BC936DRAFT_147266 [Jimgerdemannia flammicorona]
MCGGHHFHTSPHISPFVPTSSGNYFLRSSVINSSAHHTVHHLYFNYNYGQYFTLWDRIGGSHRQPTDEQYNTELRNDRKIWQKQAKDSDSIDAKTEVKKTN